MPDKRNYPKYFSPYAAPKEVVEPKETKRIYETLQRVPLKWGGEIPEIVRLNPESKLVFNVETFNNDPDEYYIEEEIMTEVKNNHYYNELDKYNQYLEEKKEWDALKVRWDKEKLEEEVEKEKKLLRKLKIKYPNI